MAQIGASHAAGERATELRNRLRSADRHSKGTWLRAVLWRTSGDGEGAHPSRGRSVSGGSLASVPVEDDERLARFVLSKRHVLKSGDGVKAEALLAYKHVELSVTRHRDLTEDELWQLGWEVAAIRAFTEERSIPL